MSYQFYAETEQQTYANHHDRHGDGSEKCNTTQRTRGVCVTESDKAPNERRKCMCHFADSGS